MKRKSSCLSSPSGYFLSSSSLPPYSELFKTAVYKKAQAESSKRPKTKTTATVINLDKNSRYTLYNCDSAKQECFVMKRHRQYVEEAMKVVERLRKGLAEIKTITPENRVYSSLEKTIQQRLLTRERSHQQQQQQPSQEDLKTPVCSNNSTGEVSEATSISPTSIPTAIILESGQSEESGLIDLFRSDNTQETDATIQNEVQQYLEKVQNDLAIQLQQQAQQQQQPLQGANWGNNISPELEKSIWSDLEEIGGFRSFYY